MRTVQRQQSVLSRRRGNGRFSLGGVSVGAINVCPGVYQVGGGSLSHGSDCLVFMVIRNGSAVLIDSGAGMAPQRILDNIKSLGMGPGTVPYIIATHGHIDHIGGLPFLKDALQSRLVAHQLELPAIADGDPRLTAAAYYGVDYRGCPVEEVLQGDDDIPLEDWTLHCLHTPGHTVGGISVYLDTGTERVLFGQDIHGPFIKEWGADMDDWHRSMQRLLDLEADILCEGHFGIYKPAERVRRYIESYVKQNRR